MEQARILVYSKAVLRRKHIPQYTCTYLLQYLCSTVRNLNSKPHQTLALLNQFKQSTEGQDVDLIIRTYIQDYFWISRFLIG